MFNALLYRDVKFDPVKDFRPIALAASSAYFLAVHPSVPAKSVAELVALAPDVIVVEAGSLAKAYIRYIGTVATGPAQVSVVMHAHPKYV